jgi:arylsulfatase A-like enzyme
MVFRAQLRHRRSAARSGCDDETDAHDHGEAIVGSDRTAAQKTRCPTLAKCFDKCALAALPQAEYSFRVVSWLRRASGWLAPSAVAACCGGIAAALVDGHSGAGSLLLGAGFVTLLVVPILFAASIVTRALYAAWQPRELADAASPRFAAWLLVIGCDAALLGASSLVGTRWFAANSAFAPMSVAYFESTLAATIAIVLAALSRPMARLACVALAPAARRWPGAFRPRVVIEACAAIAVGIASTAWLAIVRPSLGAFDTSLFYAPAAALAIAGLAHATWHRWGRLRVGASVLVTGACLAASVAAVAATRVAPGATLELWGDRALAGLAIDRVFDLDHIRDAISLAEFAPVPRPGTSHPDIILVTIDTVRADHTPPYGGHADMPTLAALAQQGTVFEWAFSPSNVTRRSIPSMITGLGADRVHGRVVSWALRIDPRHVLLAERLQAAGYETAGFMCCESFWGPTLHTGLQRGLEHLEIEHDGAKLAKLARSWLEARAKRPNNRPLFLWIHILEPHNWSASGEPPAADRTRVYDHVLTQCDAMLADLVAPFRSAGTPPIFVVTADHGEGLGEHGHLNHSTDLYDSQLHVPLVIEGPGIPAQRVHETVSSTNLVPTLLELAGFQPPAGGVFDGASFADLATGARSSRPDGEAFAAMIKDRSNPGGITAFIDGSWKIIDDGSRLELYDLATDPDEKTDLAPHEPAKLAELTAKLRARQAAGRISPF